MQTQCGQCKPIDAITETRAMCYAVTPALTNKSLLLRLEQSLFAFPDTDVLCTIWFLAQQCYCTKKKGTSKKTKQETLICASVSAGFTVKRVFYITH